MLNKKVSNIEIKLIMIINIYKNIKIFNKSIECIYKYKKNHK
jgi:hypothetical protein